MDISLQQLYAAEERVSAAEAAVIAIVVPVVCMVAWCLTLEGRVLIFRQLNLSRRLWEVNMSVLGLLLSLGLASVTTNVFKVTVGRPRPDFINRCQPDLISVEDLLPGLANYSVCTQTNHAILKDGFRSFPSGHSSTAFAGLAYLASWLSGKLRIMDGNSHVWKIAVVAAPLLAASLIAISRVMDERHHAFDVLFGSGLGMITAWASYRQYFPAVRTSGVAYDARRSAISSLIRDVAPQDEERALSSPINDVVHEPATPIRPLDSDHNDELTGFGNQSKTQPTLSVS